MKVSVLSVTVCPATQSVIRYFNEKGFEIDSVIIENSYRKKFSLNERLYRETHDRFNRKTRKYSLIRRIARRLWDLLPHYLKRFIQNKIYYLPVLRRFSLRKFCENHSINVFEVTHHSSGETTQILREREIDYLLMVSSNWLLKEPLLSAVKTKIINAHSGWLPKHRGLDSIAWSLIENDKVGLTTHFVDSGVDSGPILRFYQAEINAGDNFNTICRKVGSLQPSAFFDTLEGLRKNEITPQEQSGEYKPHTPIGFQELIALEEKLTGQGLP